MKKVVLGTAAMFNLLLFIPASNLLSFPTEKTTINFESMFNESMQYLMDENYTKAISGFEKLDSIDNKNSNIHYNLGICYLRSKKDLGKAIGYLEKAIEHISKKHNSVRCFWQK